MDLLSLPTPMHFISGLLPLLDSHGYTALRETDDWSSPPRKFYVVRDGVSIVAVNMTDCDSGVVASLSLDFARTAAGASYAGRPLRAAGAAVVDDSSGAPRTSLFATDGAVAVGGGAAPPLQCAVAAALSVPPSAVRDYDAYLFDCAGSGRAGASRDLVCAPGLSLLAPASAAAAAFAAAPPPRSGLLCLSASGRFDRSLTARVLCAVGCGASFRARSVRVCCAGIASGDGAPLGSGLYHFGARSAALSRVSVPLKQLAHPPPAPGAATVFFPVVGLHSARETCHANDLNELKKLFEELFRDSV